jgi:hypothetical protein
VEIKVKAFWDNIFFDSDNGNSREYVAKLAGEYISNDLESIRNAILNHEPKKALEIIDESLKIY